MGGERSFVWDAGKAALNQAKHGVSFVTAVGVFEDAYRLERLDDRYDYGEARYVVVGRVGDILLTVTYTPRRGVTRVISARAASRAERRAYLERFTG